MKVYWETTGGNKGFPGRTQKVNWVFKYAGKRRCIPAIYRFPEGYIFDLLTILDEAELRAFYERYKGAEESLSRTQCRAIEDEHPYQSVPMGKISINGEHPTGWSSSGKFHIPWKEDAQIELTDEIAAYSGQISGSACFVCDRYTIPIDRDPLSKRERFFQWLCPKRIRSIEIETSKTTRFLPIELSFTLPCDFAGIHTETFRHPQTQAQHTLYFQGMEHEEVKIPAGITQKTLYVTQLSYEISPKLPESERLQFDNSMTWESVPEDTGAFSPASAASIGIIGGSSGPTSIFVAGKREAEIPCGVQGLPLHICFAIPSAVKKKKIEVALQGVNIDHLEQQTFSWEN